jgi:hypothetical protein
MGLAPSILIEENSLLVKRAAFWLIVFSRNLKPWGLPYKHLKVINHPP